MSADPSTSSPIRGPSKLGPRLPTAAPEITGGVALGQTLTCSNGTWSPAGSTYVTIWQRGRRHSLASGETLAV